MNTLASIQELARAIRNMIRTGIVVETDLEAGRCRVQTGGIYTDWLQWLTHRAGRSRTWWAPSVGEQVMILAVAVNSTLPLCCRAFIPTTTPHPRPRRMPGTLSFPTVLS